MATLEGDTGASSGGSGSYGTRGWFATQILRGLGAPISTGNLSAILSWMGGENTRARNNPLATTWKSGPSAVGSTAFNSNGGNPVRNYASPELGLQATLNTIRLGYYDSIVSALVAGTTPEALGPLVNSSPWGTHNFPAVNGENYSQHAGTPLGQQYGGSSSGSVPVSDIGPSVANSPELATGNDSYPAGGEVLLTGYAPVIRYRIAPDLFMEFVITDKAAFDRSGYTTDGARQYYELPDQQLIDYKEAGDASELGDLGESGMSMEDIFTDILGRHFSPHDPARNDPGILHTIARLVANPDLDPAAVLPGWLQNTDWYQTHTDQSREWNGLSQAEQEARVQDQARALADDWWTQVGVRLSIADPKIIAWATEVASGVRTYSAVFQDIQTEAALNPESPFSRSVRNEEIAQGQYDADIENQTMSVKQLALDWGIQLGDDQAAIWADDITMNVRTAADFDEFLKTQAEILYPWKDRNTRTVDAATSWTNAYARIMETAVPTLENADIQKAMQSGTSLFDFEQELRHKPEWLSTGNAQDEFTSAAGDLARQMGFE